MEELFDPGNTDPFSPYLITEEEAPTISLVIGFFLSDVQTERANRAIGPDEDSVKYFESYSMAQETLDLIEKGQRVLRTEADLYLVGISTKWFVGVFNKSLGEDGYRAAAQKLGILPEDFVEHAITANRILGQLPEHIQALMAG